MSGSGSHRHRAAASGNLAAGVLRHLRDSRGRVAPALCRRYRTALAGGLGLLLVAAVSAVAVVEQDPGTARADLTALEAATPASPGVAVPQDEELDLAELDVEVELSKDDVWHLRDAEAASRNAERQALAEQQAAEQEAATEQSEVRSHRVEEESGDTEQPAEPAEEEPLAAAGAGQGGERGSIAAMVNSFRSQNGLSALGRDGTLDQVAQNWAEWMAGNQTLQHNPNYRSQIGGGWSAAGENIVRNTGAQSWSAGRITEWMVGWWKNSSVHRANMLGSDYTHVGVGYAMGSGGPYAVLLLGGR